MRQPPILVVMRHNIFKSKYHRGREVMNMFKVIVIFIPLLLFASQIEGAGYEVAVTGEDIGIMKDVSLCAGDHSLYLAYVPPDQSATAVVELSPELAELNKIQIDGLTSPCIRVYDGKVYLAGIKNEEIILQVFTGALELERDHKITVEEPVNVYILPYENGILVSYAHRFLEDNLLRQDIFVKKFNFTFHEVASARLTGWDFWEDPSLAVYKEHIYISFGNDPLVSIFDRHIIITKLDETLETQAEIRYPVMTSDKINVTQANLTVLHDKVYLFFRVTDRNYTYSKFTWEGMVTIVPGNINAVNLTEELELGTEIAITDDILEEYDPAAVSAFGKTYFAHVTTDKDKKSLTVLSVDTLEELKEKLEPPEGFSYYWIAGIIVVVVAVLGYLVVRRSKAKKEEGKKKKKKSAE
jgi:hypothetical protein